jgi:hypothetical protein
LYVQASLCIMAAESPAACSRRAARRNLVASAKDTHAMDSITRPSGAMRDRETRTLEQLLQECERDTARIIGQGAANRLATWRRYSGDEEALVRFVQRVLRGESRGNGWELDQRGGVSLERIVLDWLPDMFTEDDKEEARQTLGVST